MNGIKEKSVELSPLINDPCLVDPQVTGEWSAVLPQIAAEAPPPPWCVYQAKRHGKPVGVGLFKGMPDDRGWVEIAYLTFLPCTGRGVASEVARELVRIAREQGAEGVRAHTLPQTDASTRVLEKAGFELVREVIDPEDGRVWRWETVLRA